MISLLLVEAIAAGLGGGFCHERFGWTAAFSGLPFWPFTIEPFIAYPIVLIGSLALLTLGDTFVERPVRR